MGDIVERYQQFKFNEETNLKESKKHYVDIYQALKSIG